MAAAQFNKKVVIITGASSGIGKALALEFARHQAVLVLAARRGDLLLELARQLTLPPFSLPSNSILCVPTDVTSADACQNLVNQALLAYGRIDVLVNNAGISMRSRLLDLELPVLQRVMDVNYWGTVYCTKFALPHLLESKGSVVGVSSIAGFVGLPERIGYSASKFAMRGFLDALRIEHLNDGLHVLVVSPGFTKSEIRIHALRSDGSSQGKSPLREESLMSAEDVARRIVHATHRRRRTLVMTRKGRLAVILNKLFPALVDWLVKRYEKSIDPS